MPFNELLKSSGLFVPGKIPGNIPAVTTDEPNKSLPEILFITSYPPRECGIATYSQDLITALNKKFGLSFSLKVCALESENEKYQYTDEVKYIIESSCPDAFSQLAESVNRNDLVKIVLVQHEFGLFKKQEETKKATRGKG